MNSLYFGLFGFFTLLSKYIDIILLVLKFIYFTIFLRTTETGNYLAPVFR
jgi:hypothetical protein